MNIEVLLNSLKKDRARPEVHGVMCYSTIAIFVNCNPDGTFNIDVPFPEGRRVYRNICFGEAKKILSISYNIERTEGYETSYDTFHEECRGSENYSV